MNSRHEVGLVNHSDEAMADRIWSTFQVSYRIEAALLSVDSFPPLERSKESIQKSRGYFWCFERAGYLAGVLEAEKTPNGFGICSLAVVPEFFRQGIASALLSHFLGEANAKSVIVTTARLNAPALSLYQRFGFVERASWNSIEGIELVSLEWSDAH